MGATPIYAVATISPNRAKPRGGGRRGSAAAKIRSTDRADEELLPGTNLVRCADEELLASTVLFPCHASFAANGEWRRQPQAKIKGARASSDLFRAGIINSPPRALLRHWARCKLLSKTNRRLDRTMRSLQCVRSRTTTSKKLKRSKSIHLRMSSALRAGLAAHLQI